MKAFSLICLSILTLGSSPYPSPQIRPAQEQAPSLWTAQLEFLNQAPDTRLGPQMKFSQPIDVDLAQYHRNEIKQWNDEAVKNFGAQRSKNPERRDQINRFFHQKIRQQNNSELKDLLKELKGSRSSLADHRFTASKVLAELKTHPIAGLSSTANYDATGQIGFCFGRAMLAHYQLLKAGVPQNDMAKIFLFGDLMVHRQLWKFHVALVLRDKKDGLVVVDPLFDTILPLNEWMEKTSAFEVKGKWSRARYYITDPRKFLPSFGKYHRDQLEDPHLRKYFDDLAVNL